jgi:type III restriction enzyme
MSSFHFEKNLDHQSQAVESTIVVFEGLELQIPLGVHQQSINPLFQFDKGFQYVNNIRNIQAKNSIVESIKGKSTILDIMMETGTGKTYTYTKTIFELNKLYGIFKFVVIVPTLSIKAGTVDFLKSDSSRDHFQEQYGKTLNLHIVESKKGNKKKKEYIPQAVNSFVNAGNFAKNEIQVLIINAGMINSDTMAKSFDRTVFDTYSVPFEAIAATNPFVIIDEPHKFGQGKTTWGNIQKMNPQFIIRYGATFPEYENLIYTLTAVDSFNRNLVKGVVGHITHFDTGKNAILKLIDSDGTEATFEFTDTKRKVYNITAKESLEKIHPAMQNLIVEKLNKTTVSLSNGLELKKGDKINPYSYTETLQETMIAQAIIYHFELEKDLLTREVKIKPLTLFFIDNIDEYRNEEGYTKKTVEKYIEAEIKSLLKTEKDIFYRAYLEKTLEDISKTHGGYFSKDNTANDEAIEKEVEEILHDKQAMLSLDNPRRFIFSKWTLREGWDNPNVFQICKLRSSGSEISKLQEVGRGLRLPVNEYGNRVKDEQFYLNYFVDFTETDFIDKLKDEINEKSGAISLELTPSSLSPDMIQKIFEKYSISEEELLEQLDTADVIKRNNDFKDGGFNYIKRNFPAIFEGVNSNKIRKITDQKKKVAIRTEKYSELKELWEKLNQKVILEYKIEDEKKFQELFIDFLKETDFIVDGIKNTQKRIAIENTTAIVQEESSIYNQGITRVSTMSYADFLKQLSHTLNINIKTLHSSFASADIDINQYLSNSTIRLLKEQFDKYLMYNAIDTFGIEYQKVTNTIHPTKFTDKSGEVRTTITASDVGGIIDETAKVDSHFMLDKLFYDSELERDNITKEIKEVIVFTKIPKNSIKIPVAGGKSYSPDFAYVLNLDNKKKKLYFIVETKNTDKESLRNEETQKLRHAEEFFGNTIKIQFKTQLQNKQIAELISEIIQTN